MHSSFVFLALSSLISGVFAANGYGQCDGIEWTGSTSCEDGFKCEYQNPWYSQCLPYNEPHPPPTPSVVSTTSILPSSTGGPMPPKCNAFNGDKTGFATTTRYYDGRKGACGCGSGDSLSPWQAAPGPGLFTAAGSQNLFGGSGSWCGSGCGTCYNLTNVGAIAAPGEGTCAGAGQTITVMVTNLCPAQGNEKWCTGPNQFGYSAHFDIMSQGGGPQGWDNPVVRYQRVACPVSLAADWHSCECAT